MSFRFHHIGVVTAHLEKSCEFYKSLGYESSTKYLDPLQMVDIIFMKRADAPMVELIRPTNPKSPAQAWLERVKAGPYHLCYEVENLDETIDTFRKSGLTVASKPTPAVAFDGRLVSFLWSLSSGLIELLQM